MPNHGPASSPTDTTATASAPVGREHDCGGWDLDPAALIRSAHEIEIHAPLSRVWQLQTDVENWPVWQPPVLTMERLDQGPFAEGSRFRWTTPAPESEFTPADTLSITSTVRHIEPYACLLWTGPAVGAAIRIDAGVHRWTFTEIAGSTVVHTEETWTGALVESNVAVSTAALGAGLQEWLRNLKAAAERH